ncbi:hypothetical protein DS509_24995 [Salmonella enterica subsp. diarizonae]|nr:hypothetical protein [Salmonella enterica subsp. diarizonae]
MPHTGTGFFAPPRSLGRYAPAVRLRRALPPFTHSKQQLCRLEGKKPPPIALLKKPPKSAVI